MNHFHIYFSTLSNGSCGGLTKSSTTAATHNCIFATNGGPFSSKNCLGWIVSDGVYYDSVPVEYDCFGLTQDGYFVMGSITEKEVHSLGFEQLISGFNWLVQEEKNVASTTNKFIAPRTAIGTDKDGRLLIFEADGIEDDKIGLTLFQTAEWMIDLGGYNCVNLDGGGSSVAYYQGKIISVPTCKDTPEVCERPVTTITCVK